MLEFLSFLLTCVWKIVLVLVAVIVAMLLLYTITVIVKSMRRGQ